MTLKNKITLGDAVNSMTMLQGLLGVVLAASEDRRVHIPAFFKLCNSAGMSREGMSLSTSMLVQTGNAKMVRDFLCIESFAKPLLVERGRQLVEALGADAIVEILRS